jgi:hypothetical protein
MTIYPTPSPEGIDKLKAIYRNDHKMEITDEKAYEILSGVMRFLYLTRIKQLSPEEAGQPSRPGGESTPQSP